MCSLYMCIYIYINVHNGVGVTDVAEDTRCMRRTDGSRPTCLLFPCPRDIWVTADERGRFMTSWKWLMVIFSFATTEGTYPS